MALRTTFIIGHPGETKSDFAELMSFVEENAFERMGGFIYSAEEGTPAARFRGQVRSKIARERLDQLNDAYDRWSSDQSVDKIGQRMRVLIESRTDEGQWEGRSMHDAPDIDGRVVLEADAVGHPGFYEVTVTRADGVDLYARPVKGHAVRVMETIS